MTQVLEKDSKRTIGETSIDAKIIYDLLKSSDVGDIVTYERISEVIGRDILKNRYLLQTARNMVKRDENMVFDCIPKKGIKRLSNAEIVEKVSTQPFRRIGSVIRNTGKDILCVNNDEITNDEKIKLNATRSLFGVIGMFAKNSAVKQIEKEASDPVPFGKVLEMFK